METYSLLALLFAALVLGLVLVLVRRYRSKVQSTLQEQETGQETLEQLELIRVQNPSQQDLQAYTLIEAERNQVWKRFSSRTSLSPKKISHLAVDLVQKIAAVYHPDCESPELLVSVLDLLELNDRILQRLKQLLEDFPLNTIKDLNVRDILTYKNYYDKVSQFSMVQFARKNKYLYSIGRYAWMGYNVLNPWYWGKKVVMTAGKEGTFRYLLTAIITIVGEETVLVFSKRHVRTTAVAVEKNIAFEMVNMALTDHIVSQEEYEVVLEFVLNNALLSDQLKVLVLKALLRKRPLTSELSLEQYTAKTKKRLLSEVERVAQADTLSMLKKREALKALEQSLDLKSSYRTRLELMPHEEVRSWDLLQQRRQREDGILRLMAQAGSVEPPFPESLDDYIRQRAASYPLPFSDQEQAAILQETTAPTPLDALTNRIVTQAEKERALGDVLDALLWYLPFSRQKEAFLMQIVVALGLQKQNEQVLLNRLEHLLPPGKLIDKPSAPVLKALFRLLHQDEQITALQRTATLYHFFLREEKKSRKKEAAFWLCITTRRILALAATTVDHTLYHHHEEFQNAVDIRIESGKFYDTYVLQEQDHELRLENVLFHSDALKHALASYLPE